MHSYKDENERNSSLRSEDNEKFRICFHKITLQINVVYLLQRKLWALLKIHRFDQTYTFN